MKVAGIALIAATAALAAGCSSADTGRDDTARTDHVAASVVTPDPQPAPHTDADPSGMEYVTALREAGVPVSAAAQDDAIAAGRIMCHVYDDGLPIDRMQDVLDRNMTEVYTAQQREQILAVLIEQCEAGRI